VRSGPRLPSVLGKPFPDANLTAFNEPAHAEEAAEDDRRERGVLEGWGVECLLVARPRPEVRDQGIKQVSAQRGLDGEGL